MDAKAGTTANTIEGVYTVSYNGKTQERQQLSIERARCCEIASRNECMGNTVDFHSIRLPRVTGQRVAARLVGLAHRLAWCAIQWLVWLREARRTGRRLVV